ncbi:MAG: ATP-binding protein [Spirochaetia bacterium]|nr:ATP-binding protein [Spirochaetia bacterium]
MKSSLFKRLFTTLSLLIIIIFSLNYYFTLRTFRQHHVLLEKENLLKHIKSIEPEINKKYLNLLELQKYINGISQILDIRLTIIDENGRVLADSQKKAMEMDNHIHRPEIVDSKTSTYGFSVRFSDTIKKEMLYVAVHKNSPFKGFIRASVFLASIDSFLYDFKKSIIIAAIFFLASGLAGTFFLTQSISRPIGKLAQAANQIAKGNFDVNIPEFDTDELSELAANFRVMSQEIKSLETIKRDLIANVSHELRTPLTAIKGFIETLNDEFDGPNKKYLDIIERHTDRLIFIVQDLLILSRLEDSGIEPDYQMFSLNSVISDTVLLLDKKARQKELSLKVIENGEIGIEADRNQLVQLFVNLIDNAVKYTEKGEVSIEIKKDEKFAMIDIRDTGIGMEKKHLSRIFERFYVVDSSRSRIQGGTGLGLSIVKHVIHNHKGFVEINSAPGKGTQAHIRLPLIQTRSLI